MGEPVWPLCAGLLSVAALCAELHAVTPRAHITAAQVREARDKRRP